MRFIIIGGGDVGTTLSSKLSGDQHDVVLIEKNESRAEKLAASLEIATVVGNGCMPEVLFKAGISTADYLISVADNDEVNIASCLVSKLLNPAARRVARIRDINLVHKDISTEQLDEYFDFIVNPEQAAAEHLLQLFKTPGAKEVVEFANGRLRVLGINVEPDSDVLDRRIDSLKEYRDKFPVLIIAIIRRGKLIVPKGNDFIRLGDTIYLTTVPEKTGVLFELAGKKLYYGKSAMVWGSSPLVKILVHSLEAQGADVKLLISESAAASSLVDEFRHTLLLQGDGTDEELLLEEGIDEIDAFIAASDHEEDNILAALLAKRLGVRATMAVVSKSTYIPLVTTIGVDAVVSSRVAAASAIYHHIHSDSILSEFSLMHRGASFIEIRANSKISFLGTPIRKIKFPYGILIGGIVRLGEVIIPTGDDVVLEGDTMLLFVLLSARQKLEKLLNIKLELFA